MIFPGWRRSRPRRARSPSRSTRSACADFGAEFRCGRWRKRALARRVGGSMKQDNIGIAVIGAGRIGTLRARLAAKHPAVRFLAVSDRDPARAGALAEAAGADVHSTSNEEVIGHPRVTALIV